MKKYFFFIIIYLLPILGGFAQQKVFMLGDTLGNITIGHLFDPVTNNIIKATLNDFPERIVILDFWNTACAACINAWPKLEKLQTQFGKDIKIILVNTEENLDRIKNMLDRRAKISGRRLQLPIAFNNAPLRNQFNYKTVPHYVWIDKDRVISSVTGSDELIEENINRALNGNFSTIEQKPSNRLKFDHLQSFFQQGLIDNLSAPVFYSILSKANRKFIPLEGYAAESAGKTSIFFINASVLGLYQLAHRDEQFQTYPLSRIELDVKDTILYVPEVNGKLNWENLYCYQLVAPGKISRKEDLYSKLIDDLNKSFGLTAVVEKKVKKSLVLYAWDTSLPATKTRVKKLEYSPFDLKMQHATVSDFVSLLNNIFLFTSPYPIIDETSFAGHLDMHIEASMFDHQSISKALEKYSMGFKIEDRLVDVLVIREASKN